MLIISKKLKYNTKSVLYNTLTDKNNNEAFYTLLFSSKFKK